MACDIHLQVSFACDNNDGVAELARQHLVTLDTSEYSLREAIWFLTSLAERSGYNPGPKGGLSLWGIVANGEDAPHRFVYALEEFWRLLLRGTIDGGPCYFERVVVMYEQEQTEAANAYDIGWGNEWPEHWGEDHPINDDSIPDDRVLLIRKHGPLPFAWRQY